MVGAEIEPLDDHAAEPGQGQREGKRSRVGRGPVDVSVADEQVERIALSPVGTDAFLARTGMALGDRQAPLIHPERVAGVVMVEKIHQRHEHSGPGLVPGLDPLRHPPGAEEQIGEAGLQRPGLRFDRAHDLQQSRVPGESRDRKIGHLRQLPAGVVDRDEQLEQFGLLGGQVAGRPGKREFAGAVRPREVVDRDQQVGRHRDQTGDRSGAAGAVDRQEPVPLHYPQSGCDEAPMRLHQRRHRLQGTPQGPVLDVDMNIGIRTAHWLRPSTKRWNRAADSARGRAS